MRSAIAAVVLLLALREWPGRWSWWLGSGALAGAASMLGFVIATKLTTAANAIFLVYTAPLYVALLSPWVLHEPIRRGDWLTLLLALLGLGCFCVEQLTWAGWVGNLCALGSGLAGVARGVLTQGHGAAAHPRARQSPGGPRGAPVPGGGHAGSRALGTPPRRGRGATRDLDRPLRRAMPHVQAIEAIMIPSIEPVLNPLWVWLLVGEVPSGWALVGGTIVVGAVTARGLTLVWHTPREDVARRTRRDGDLHAREAMVRQRLYWACAVRGRCLTPALPLAPPRQRARMMTRPLWCLPRHHQGRGPGAYAGNDCQRVEQVAGATGESVQPCPQQHVPGGEPSEPLRSGARSVFAPLTMSRYTLTAPAAVSAATGDSTLWPSGETRAYP